MRNGFPAQNSSTHRRLAGKAKAELQSGRRAPTIPDVERPETARAWPPLVGGTFHTHCGCRGPAADSSASTRPPILLRPAWAA